MKSKIENLSCGTLTQLVRRHILIYFRDKALIFFSVLSPLIVLVLYVAFLADIQISGIEESVPEGIALTQNAIKGFVDSWLIAGVLSVTCVTVSLNAMSVMVGDREKNIISDFKAAPVSPSLIQISYFIANFLITLAISLIIFGVSMGYLAITGSFKMNASDIFETVGILILSILSSTALMTIVAKWFKTESSYGGFGGIISAVIGFFIGAYMPISLFPKPVQFIANVLPGSHSAGLFRNTIMRGTYAEVASQSPEIFAKELSASFSMRLNLFGAEIGKPIMYVYLAASVLILIGLNLLISQTSLRKSFKKSRQNKR